MAVVPSLPKLSLMAQSKSSYMMSRCSSSIVAALIFSAVLQSGMPMHNSIALMIMHMPGVSSSLFFWLCLGSHSVINSCGTGLCRVFPLHCWICNSIHCSLCDRLAKSFLKITTSGLWSVLMLTSQVKQ